MTPTEKSQFHYHIGSNVQILIPFNEEATINAPFNLKQSPPWKQQQR